MSNDLEAERPRLANAATLARLAFIGIALAAVAGTFAYLGGWLTPNALTPARLTDGLEEVNGVHPGFRRNHAKGLRVSGFFDSNGSGVGVSKAVVFRPGRVPVIGRFSLAGGQPNATDTPDAVRGLGLQFSLPNGELWRTAMISRPVFPVRTPEAFYEQLLASKPDPVTGKPDPAEMKAFLARHPETVQALAVINSQPFWPGFANSSFHGLNAFRFINAAVESIPARWLLTPMQPFEAAGTASVSQDKNYLFEALIAAIHRQPLRWRLIVILGQPGDPTNDATIP
jgi:catalase